MSNFSTKGIFDNKVYDGIVDCLKALKENGKVLLVATSKPEKFAKQIIDHFDLAQYFVLLVAVNLIVVKKKRK